MSDDFAWYVAYERLISMKLFSVSLSERIKFSVRMYVWKIFPKVERSGKVCQDLSRINPKHPKCQKTLIDSMIHPFVFIHMKSLQIQGAGQGCIIILV